MFLVNLARPTDFFTGSGLAYAFIGSVELRDTSPHLHETATNWGAKNARALVTRQWASAPRRRLAHIASPQIKSVGMLCERLFAGDYHTFRANKFRSINDLLVAGYLNPVVGYFEGKFLFCRARWWYVKIRDHTAPKIYAAILSEKNKEDGRIFACFNDHPQEGGNLADAGFQLQQMLDQYFPEPSSFELADPGR
jgi:hypothetical protein